MEAAHHAWRPTNPWHQLYSDIAGRAGKNPAKSAVARKASRSALVAFEANHYSVPPAHAGRTVTVHARVGEPILRLLSQAGEIVATHRRATAGAGQTVRSM